MAIPDHKQKLINYIRAELLELSTNLYPNDPHRQMLYQIGFMQAQLSEAILRDSHALDRFRSAINKYNLPE